MGGKPSRSTPADKRLSANRASKPSPKLTAAKRNALPKSQFAIPGKKAYPSTRQGELATLWLESRRTEHQHRRLRSWRAVASKYPSIDVSGMQRQSGDSH